VLTEDDARRRVDLAEKLCSMTRITQSDLDATDASEESHDPQSSGTLGRRL
jgi:hypothetical protein